MDRRRPLNSPRLLEPLGGSETRRRQPEAKPDGRLPALLPSLSTPRQQPDDARAPAKRCVAALSPLNAVTPDARQGGMRRHFFDEPGPPLVTPQPSEPKTFDTAVDARPPRSRPTPAARRGLPPRDPLARNTPQPRVADLGLKLEKIWLGASPDPARTPDIFGRGRSASPANLSRKPFDGRSSPDLSRRFEPSPEIFERVRSGSPADFLPADLSRRSFAPADLSRASDLSRAPDLTRRRSPRLLPSPRHLPSPRSDSESYHK